MCDNFLKSVKFTIFITNGVIVLGGLLSFTIGVWTLAMRTFMEKLLGSNLYVTSASLLILAGVIVTFASIIGSFATYKENRYLLLTYSIVLFFAFILMLISGVFALESRHTFEEHMYREMITAIKRYGRDDTITDAWDSVQINFCCCGISVNGKNGYEIWTYLNKGSFGGVNHDMPKVPKSCCKNWDNETIEMCQSNPRSNSTWHDDCYAKMKDYMRNHAELISRFAIGSACLLIVGIIFSYTLFFLIKFNY